MRRVMRSIIMHEATLPPVLPDRFSHIYKKFDIYTTGMYSLAIANVSLITRFNYSGRVY